MRELITLWRNTRMVVLVALIAALYAALIIPFKVATILPGITEVRPATAIPLVCGILFGPAAAWGSAFGNLIADFFGTLGPGSLFGFIGNFLYAYVAYRLWKLLGGGRSAFALRGPGPRLLGTILLCSTVTGVLVFYSVGWQRPDFSNPLLPHAFKVTLGLLILLNAALIRAGSKSRQPSNLHEVMDENSGETPALLPWTYPGLGVCALFVVCFWDNRLPLSATLALAEMLVIVNAVALGFPVWKVLRDRPASRVAAATFGRFVLVAFIASMVCAFVVGFGVEAVAVAPFGIVAPIVMVNNFALSLLLGPLLLAILHPRVAAWGLLTEDVLDPGDRDAGFAPPLGAILVGALSALGLVVGCWMAFSPDQAAMGLSWLSSFGLELSPATPPWQATSGFFLVLLAGVALL